MQFFHELLRDDFKADNFCAPGVQFKPPGDSLVRFAISLAVMPPVKTGLVLPIGLQPDFFGFVGWAEHFHANEARFLVNTMRPVLKGLPDRIKHVIRDGETADNNEHRPGPQNFLQRILADQVSLLHSRFSSIELR